MAGDEVIDRADGLAWRRCSEGQQWTGADCAGAPTYAAWFSALDDARAQARATGKAWRLPNIKELESLARDDGRRPAIDLRLFPGTVLGTGIVYLTSTAFFDAASTRANSVWTVYFTDGSTGNGVAAGYYRLVRDLDDF